MAMRTRVGDRVLCVGLDDKAGPIASGKIQAVDTDTVTVNFGDDLIRQVSVHNCWEMTILPVIGSIPQELRSSRFLPDALLRHQHEMANARLGAAIAGEIRQAEHLTEMGRQHARSRDRED